jgi:hypothetical protein
VQGEPSTRSTARGVVAVFLSLAGVATAMTLLFLGMRAVMDIGGVCAEGGPYLPRQPCPKGVPLLMVGGIWAGLIFAGVYVWQASKHGVVSFAWALWPALFLSLGWNFLEYGLDPPGDGGPVWGWLVCAVLFILMGGGPLLGALPPIWRAITGRAPAPSPREILRPPGTAAIPARIWAPPGSAGSGSAPVTPPSTMAPASPSADTSMPVAAGPSEDLVSALERLSYLHRTGAIDDAEYETAKARLLGEP